jgi:hypothetical protein
MASKTGKKNDRAAVDAGFLLRLKALEELNKTLPAELRLSIKKNRINDSLSPKATTKANQPGRG